MGGPNPRPDFPDRLTYRLVLHLFCVDSNDAASNAQDWKSRRLADFVCRQRLKSPLAKSRLCHEIKLIKETEAGHCSLHVGGYLATTWSWVFRPMEGHRAFLELNGTDIGVFS